MNNPFELIEKKLSTIESLLINLNEQPQASEHKKANEQFLTVQEAAKLLNLTVPTIYSKVSKGELPVMKRSKRLYFSNIELMEYIKKGRKKTSSEITNEANDYLNTKKG